MGKQFIQEGEGEQFVVGFEPLRSLALAGRESGAKFQVRSSRPRATDSMRRSIFCGERIKNVVGESV